MEGQARPHFPLMQDNLLFRFLVFNDKFPKTLEAIKPLRSSGLLVRMEGLRPHLLGCLK